MLPLLNPFKMRPDARFQTRCGMQRSNVACNMVLGITPMLHSDDNFSSGVSFSEIPESFSRFT
jgi:hypothetical protein